jgi:hypothetical protein
MFWMIWALLLVTHGALSRWVQSKAAQPLVATCSDVLLMAIGLLTIDQLQGLGALSIARVGLFFVAFGYAGRQLIGCYLKPRYSSSGPISGARP